MLQINFKAFLPAAMALLLVATACGERNASNVGDTDPPLPAPSSDSDQGGTSYEPSAFASAVECEPYIIRELPSGELPGEPTWDEWTSNDDSAVTYPVVTWGNGRDEVTVTYGFESIDPENRRYKSPEDFLRSGKDSVVEVDGQARVVVLVGDEGLGEVQIRFVQSDCPYILYLPAAEFGADGVTLWEGYTLSEALDYARRF